MTSTRLLGPIREDNAVTKTTMGTGVTDVRNLIGGEWREGRSTVDIRYPFDGRIVARAHTADGAIVDTAIGCAQTAFGAWRAAPGHQRSAVLTQVADAMRAEAKALAHEITLETGKTLAEAQGEVARSIVTMEISAAEATRISGEVIPMDAVPQGTGKLGFTVRTPMGVIGCITPFNAPLNTLCHKVGPAIAAGNTVVVKPHLHGSGVAAFLAQAFLDSKAPDGCLNLVHGGPDVGQTLVSHPGVALVNFTGSGAVADRIVRQIGLKRSLLELGGNAPTIVHLDADLERAVAECLGAAFGLAGQSCISTQRIYAHEAIYESVVERIAAGAESLVTGDPVDPSTKMGPMISEAAAKRVESWVNEAVSGGALLRCGGTRHGSMMAPTVLTDVSPGMKVACDEVFGPVVTVTPYSSIEDAILAANASPWGLKCGIFTSSLKVALDSAAGLGFGTVNVNGPSRARVDHEPSGGIKASGWGLEGPRYAIEAMTHLKMVSVAP